MKVEIELPAAVWKQIVTEAKATNRSVAEVITVIASSTGTAQAKRRNSIEVMTRAGLCDAAIGERLNMTTTSVAAARRRLGLPANKRKWK